ncbi:hypothetical protein FVEN_g5405 [Fusarium venenatum]|uniref:Uncharacterized protein n=1 Tax=Fusarium venenatum TaxID=56646 RepID=A0A2L2U279_9HYPO|nr:uncharacterized protein FVRRES_08512 [Fusarium venenatum]KAG8356813.1 hypothetical protein FVEN_g5405 [Fusarium venenatum]CEI68435.1 unnamed protein product [Fusarium venenatum]
MLAIKEFLHSNNVHSSLVLSLCAAACACLGLLVHTLVKRKNLNRYVRLSSPSPEPVKKTASADYTNVYPPPQRHVLPEISPDFSPNNVDLSAAPRLLLRLDQDYRYANPAAYNFTGFSVDEIKRLGAFPDYAKLSGVPLPTPLKNFDLDAALPRPYRPFRWAYHQTMSLKKMDPDFWIEIENTYRSRIIQRQILYAKYGRDVLQALPGSELACKELMEMVIQFICARYPQAFELHGRVFVNHLLGVKQDLGQIEPLLFLLNHVPEDFALTLRDPATGRYCFRAGVICSSVGWKLSEKIGLGLPEIHAPVPDYKEKMEFSMDRFFTKMPTDSPIQRGSWGLEVGQPLFIPSEDPEFQTRETQSPSLTEADVHLRVDWQTLRRLPLSGAIVFNFKALFTPMSEFRDEPYVPSLVLKVLNEGKENIMKYKGTWHVEHVAKPTLRRWEREQIDKGLIPADWQPTTLDENPFFPGWEKKWNMS